MVLFQSSSDDSNVLPRSRTTERDGMASRTAAPCPHLQSDKTEEVKYVFT